MARIRTIKPNFFTSEDIVGLSAFARLLYIALWCEADREGRLLWRPGTYKLRYFPADRLHIDTLCNELIRRELVVLYDDGRYAYIPTFLEHQHVNPREAKSTIPTPPERDACARVSTRANPDEHTQVGREGKGKEREERGDARGARLPLDWKPTTELQAWASRKRPDLDAAETLAKFRDHWAAAPGAKGVKLDWDATYRNWVRNEKRGPGTPVQAVPTRQRICAYCPQPAVGRVGTIDHCADNQHFLDAMDIKPVQKVAA